jgi:hypothetical protein
MLKAAGWLGALVAGIATSPCAAAPDTAAADAQVTVVRPVSVRLNLATMLPTVRASRGAASFASEPPTVPVSFMVMRVKGSDGLNVRASSRPQAPYAGEGAVLGGELLGDSAASIGVARQMELAASDAVGGSGAAMLVLVVQYN